MDLQTAFDRGFEAVKAYVDSEIGTLTARLAELETRPVGEGDTGPQGHDGPPGPEGPQGPKGDCAEISSAVLPTELAEQIAGAARLLHEMPPIVSRETPAARVTRIERDESGAFVPIYDVDDRLAP